MIAFGSYPIIELDKVTDYNWTIVPRGRSWRACPRRASTAAGDSLPMSGLSERIGGIVIS
jgi:hypothetical protein